MLARSVLVVLCAAAVCVFVLPQQPLFSVRRHRDSVAHDTLLSMYPLTGLRDVSYKGKNFTVPTPFHCFNGRANIVVVAADHSKVSALMATRGLVTSASRQALPLTKTADGKALLLLWFMDYAETSIGAYRELVVTLLTGLPSVPCSTHDDPYCVLASLGAPGTAAGASMVALRLWLDNDAAIAYGRDLLGLDKREGRGFDVEHCSETGSLLQFHIDNVVESVSITSAACRVGMLGGVYRNAGGLKGVWAAATATTAPMVCFGTPGIAKCFPSDFNPMLHGAVVNSADSTVHRWDESAGDRLVLSESELLWSELGPLKAQCTIRHPHIRFVMTGPLN